MKAKTWISIKIGTGPKTGDELYRAITSSGQGVSGHACNLLSETEPAIATTESELKLSRVTVAELGFKKGAKRSDIYDKALKFGLDKCPSEVGPQLRLQYRDQPRRESLHIAMDPACTYGGRLHLFAVENGDHGLMLGTDFHDSEYVYVPSSIWVFVLRE